MGAECCRQKTDDVYLDTTDFRLKNSTTQNVVSMSDDLYHSQRPDTVKEYKVKAQAYPEVHDTWTARQDEYEDDRILPGKHMRHGFDRPDHGIDNISEKNEDIEVQDTPQEDNNIIIAKEESYTKHDASGAILEESREEKLRKRQMYIEDFYTETLRAAERRAGPFESKNFASYQIQQDKINLLNEMIIEEDVLTIENPDSIYWGSRNINKEKHGFGIQLQRGGIKREGFWMNDVLQPYGRYIGTDGHIVNGVIHGQGREVKSHSNYQGSFVGGVKDGFGVYENSRELYEGFFKNNMKEGEGKLYFKDSGNNYKGQFKSGKMHGKCEFNWKSGERYVGDMYEGVLQGYGIYTWPSGEVYEGEYLEGKRHGKGKFKWSNGEVFEGLFINNVPQNENKVSS